MHAAGCRANQGLDRSRADGGSDARELWPSLMQATTTIAPKIVFARNDSGKPSSDSRRARFLDNGFAGRLAASPFGPEPRERGASCLERRVTRSYGASQIMRTAFDGGSGSRARSERPNCPNEAKGPSFAVCPGLLVYPQPLI